MLNFRLKVCSVVFQGTESSKPILPNTPADYRDGGAYGCSCDGRLDCVLSLLLPEATTDGLPAVSFMQSMLVALCRV